MSMNPSEEGNGELAAMEIMQCSPDRNPNPSSTDHRPLSNSALVDMPPLPSPTSPPANPIESSSSSISDSVPQSDPGYVPTSNASDLIPIPSPNLTNPSAILVSDVPALPSPNPPPPHSLESDNDKNPARLPNDTNHDAVLVADDDMVQALAQLHDRLPDIVISDVADEPITEPVGISMPLDPTQSAAVSSVFGVHIPKKRRRGRSQRNFVATDQVFQVPPFSGGSSNGNDIHPTPPPHHQKQQQQQQQQDVMSSQVIPGNVPNSATSDTPGVGDEIIFINKEATSEALIALSAGFPADILTEEEIDAGVVQTVGGIEQVNYILIRNHIITKWRENVNNWVTREMFNNIIPPHCGALLDRAYDYLVSRGYINFGVSSAIKERMPAEPSKSNVIVIGAGLAGLAAARQLMKFGFKVTVLEGRKRPGGRVYTRKMEGANKVSAAADLGGTVLTGTLGNPLAIVARQLGISLHKIRDKCPLYRTDGSPVDPELDLKVETAFNRQLEKASRLRQAMGDVSMDVSLGAALETFKQVYGDAVTDEEMGLFNWHLANLEYANAGLLSKLSLAFWDQDDPFDMGGDHCFMPGGNGQVVQALAENVNILYEKTVNTIRYGSDGVQVVVGGQVFEGDMALCTVPLGVLKNGSIKFIPELPQRKLDSIKRLGFGLLNKVAMVFPYVFWNTELDTFGHLAEDKSRRGEFFLFYSYATLSGGPLLMTLVAGEAAHEFETMPPTDAVTRVIKILKGTHLHLQILRACILF